MLVSLWFDTEWFFYVTFIDVSANDTLLEGRGGGGGGGGSVIPYPCNSGHSYPLSLKVSTVLSLKVSLLEFFPQTKVIK